MYQDSQELVRNGLQIESAYSFDVAGIEGEGGVQEKGVDLTEMLLEVLKMGPEKFMDKMRRKFDIVYQGDPHKISKRMEIVD